MTVFERYAPFVQDFIYAHRWEKLRSVQVAAGNAVFNTDKHVLLCASTASGKTEAAFFPILTLLSEEPPASVGALYIAPLKALINDQFERLTDLNILRAFSKSLLNRSRHCCSGSIPSFRDFSAICASLSLMKYIL